MILLLLHWESCGGGMQIWLFNPDLAEKERSDKKVIALSPSKWK